MTKQQPIHLEMEEDEWPEGVRGPMLLVEVDEDAGEPPPLGPGEVYLLDGRLWLWEEPGCAVCNEEGARSSTLHTVEGTECRCLKHGALVEVPYLMKRRLEVSIGPITRASTEEIRDSMLFPATLDEDELREAIEVMLGADSDEEESEDALSADEE